MENKLLTKSDKFTSEYCCSVVKIGEVKPIEGKDKIGYTLVNGETIVIRKDQVKEGDILIYASNETQLASGFLSANNLFESGCYELNANAKEVEPYRTKSLELKNEIEKLEARIIKIERCSMFLKAYEDALALCKTEAEKTLTEERREDNRRTIRKYIGSIEESSDDIAYINAADFATLSDKQTLETLKNKREDCVEFIRSHVGFFNKNGRVRAIRLGGVNSMGYLFTLNELVKYDICCFNIDLEKMVGEDFDTVNGELFVKAYVPNIPERGSKGDGKSRDRKRNKKAERFDRLVQGEFSFHYSTDPLAKCIKDIKPDDIVTCSVKEHGTSAIFAKLHVKTPIKLPFYKRIWNKLIDITGLFKSLRITDYFVEYGNITSSRTVIKNQYINKDVTDGYYGADIWSEYGEIIYPYLEEGMTLYGEICGYVTGSQKMIQKGYDYGCEEGKNYLMPYRITTTNANGTKKEWEVLEVFEWTKKLLADHPELSERVHPIVILYHGTLSELYPNLSTTEHWHENVLEEMRNDVQHFGMEKNESLCKNKVPREGIVLRKYKDTVAEAYKLKCEKFRIRELKAIDEGEVDMEMMDTYAQQ